MRLYSDARSALIHALRRATSSRARSKFFARERATIAAMAALVLPIMIVAGAGSLEVARLVSVRAHLKKVLDGAVINCAERKYKATAADDWSTCANIDVSAAVESMDGLSDPILTWSQPDDKHIRGQLDVTLETTILDLMQLSRIQVRTAAEATMLVPKNLEVALVLDVSGSMYGAPFAQMISAAKTFVTTVFNRSSQGGEIRVSLIPFGDSVRFGAPYRSKLAPSYADATDLFDKRLISEVCDAASVTNLACDMAQTRWNGCFVDDGKRSRKPGDVTNLAPFPPMVGYSNGVRMPLCPGRGSEILLFSNNRDELLSKLGGLELSYGTSTDTAMVWARRVLDPAWRGYFHESDVTPKDYNKATVFKHVILLTDGVPLGFARQFLPDERDPTTNLEKLCTDMINDARRDVGPEIHTIAFGSASAVGAAVRKCKTDNGGYYVATLTDLSTVFSKIAAKMFKVTVRLTQ